MNKLLKKNLNLKFNKVFSLSAGIYRTKSNTFNILLKYGSYGLKLNDSGSITFNELESIRRVVSRFSRRKSKLWFRVYPCMPITVKSKSSRMGKGVGKFSYLVFFAKSGRIVFEISYINYKLAVLLLLAASKKLSLSTSMVFRFNDYIFNQQVNKYVN